MDVAPPLSLPRNKAKCWGQPWHQFRPQIYDKWQWRTHNPRISAMQSLPLHHKNSNLSPCPPFLTKSGSLLGLCSAPSSIETPLFSVGCSTSMTDSRGLWTLQILVKELSLIFSSGCWVSILFFWFILLIEKRPLGSWYHVMKSIGLSAYQFLANVQLYFLKVFHNCIKHMRLHPLRVP